MDIKKVLEIAAHCGTSVRGHYDETGCTPQELHDFAKEVARIEREECAMICENQTKQTTIDPFCCVGELTIAAGLIRNKA